MGVDERVRFATERAKSRGEERELECEWLRFDRWYDSGGLEGTSPKMEL